jgi:hypothetical protein
LWLFDLLLYLILVLLLLLLFILLSLLLVLLVVVLCCGPLPVDAASDGSRAGTFRHGPWSLGLVAWWFGGRFRLVCVDCAPDAISHKILLHCLETYKGSASRDF